MWGRPPSAVQVEQSSTVLLLPTSAELHSAGQPRAAVLT